MDLGCKLTTHTIRDHTKRKVIQEYETERYGPSSSPENSIAVQHAILGFCNGAERCRWTIRAIHADISTADKPSASSSATPRSLPACAPRRSSSSHKCTPTRGRHKSETDASWAETPEVSSETSK